MTPAIHISWGELIDKLTILEIKSEHLASESARVNVRRELEQLSVLANEAGAREPRLAPLRSELKRVNELLWQIEDDIRSKEAQKIFDADFIALARAVYCNNDERGRLKQQINTLLQSDITEEKQYAPY